MRHGYNFGQARKGTTDGQVQLLARRHLIAPLQTRALIVHYRQPQAVLGRRTRVSADKRIDKAGLSHGAARLGPGDAARGRHEHKSHCAAPRKCSVALPEEAAGKGAVPASGAARPPKPHKLT